MNKRNMGLIGENRAKCFLKDNGIEIIKSNYFTKFGEIDLIGIEKKTIIFIEVKLRNTNNFGLPYESVDERKIQRIKNAAEMFLSENDYREFDCRFDVISINRNEIEWLKNQYFY